jgi:addiction module HigA family antidote
MKINRKPTHPGALLREDVLPALKLSVSEAAKRLGVSRQHLHRILKEEHAVTPEMALRLGKLCGDGPEGWINMQIAYDMWEARERLGNALDQIKTAKVAA